MKRYRTHSSAHRVGEGRYSYRGWTLYYNEALHIWAEIDPNDEWVESAKTLNEAKHDIDVYIEEFGDIDT